MTHTLADLAAWSHPGTSLAVLGHPIKHSISPAMHNAALAELAATDPAYADWRYFRFEVPPDDLPLALALLHRKKFRGVNLTVPHKILAFTSPLIVAIDPAARPIGAINTLRWHPDGWTGYNTDGYGLATALRQDLGIDLAGTHVLLLGAGGAARGAAVECLQRRCASLTLANRTRETLDTLLRDLAPLAAGIPLRALDPADAPPPGTLVINATSAGLRPADPLPLDLAALPRPVAVYDMIYNPPETRLLASARALGLPAANGLSMLVHQGARALEHWLAPESPASPPAPAVPVAAMAAAARAAL